MRTRFEDFCLDTEKHELTRSGQPLHLTPKAFDLLVLLVSRRPRAVRQNDLFDHLWPDTLVDLSRVHQLIKEIRDAVGDDERRIIRTVYARGYAFAAPAVDMDEQPVSMCRIVVLGEPHDLRQGANVIGRDYRAAVRIDVPGVSRRHAQIVVDGDTATIEDLASRNGTFVNSRRIRSATPLANADSILFGDVGASFVILSPLPATR